MANAAAEKCITALSTVKENVLKTLKIKVTFTDFEFLSMTFKVMRIEIGKIIIS
jgi:hypothetical protein